MADVEQPFVLDTDGDEKVVLRATSSTSGPVRVRIGVRIPSQKLEGGLFAMWETLLGGLGEVVGPVAELTPEQARELGSELIRLADGSSP